MPLAPANFGAVANSRPNAGQSFGTGFNAVPAFGPGGGAPLAATTVPQAVGPALQPAGQSTARFTAPAIGPGGGPPMAATAAPQARVAPPAAPAATNPVPAFGPGGGPSMGSTVVPQAQLPQGSQGQYAPGTDPASISTYNPYFAPGQTGLPSNYGAAASALGGYASGGYQPYWQGQPSQPPTAAELAAQQNANNIALHGAPPTPAELAAQQNANNSVLNPSGQPPVGMTAQGLNLDPTKWNWGNPGTYVGIGVGALTGGAGAGLVGGLAGGAAGGAAAQGGGGPNATADPTVQGLYGTNSPYPGVGVQPQTDSSGNFNASPFGQISGQPAAYFGGTPGAANAMSGYYMGQGQGIAAGGERLGAYNAGTLAGMGNAAQNGLAGQAGTMNALGRAYMGQGEQFAGQQQQQYGAMGSGFNATDMGLAGGALGMGGSLGANAAGLQGAGQRNQAIGGLETLQSLGQQRSALGLLGSAAMGQQPSAAQIQMQQGLDQSIGAQMAMANSARGEFGLANAQRNAMQQGAAMQQAGVNQSAALRAQEMESARQAYMSGAAGMGAQGLQQQELGQTEALSGAGLGQQGELSAYGQALQATGMGQGNELQAAGLGSQYGLAGLQMGQGNELAALGQAANTYAQGANLGIGATEAGMSQQQQYEAQAQAQRMAYEQAAYQSQVQALGAREVNMQTAANLASQNAAANAQMWGSALGAIGTLGAGAAMASDERVKTELHGNYGRALAELDAFEPHTFRYNAPGLAPNPEARGEPYVGIYAQQAEQAPTGRSLVQHGPGGIKMLNQPAMVSALAAGAGALKRRTDEHDERLNALERVAQSRRRAA